MAIGSLTENPRVRYPLMALGMLALLMGLWTGLLRLGWSMASFRPSLAMVHGPLMVCCFLGTLISLERAVALGRLWAYAAPLCTGLGGVLLIAGVGTWQGPVLITAGSLILLAVFTAVLRIQLQSFAVVMALGAVAWFVGNVAWLMGTPVFHVVGWWLGFLVLTIAGERLELSRVLLHASRVHRLFMGVVALLGAGLIFAALWPETGIRFVGISLILLALWLLRYDVARHTIRQTGLTRFIAVCLMGGYVWLVVGGGLMLRYGDVTAGPAYDAMIHAVFVGFVFSMIFGHAPIIFPAVLGVPVAYRSLFYGHLALLHVSLALRVAGDLGGGLVLRQWGGLLNAAAIVLFLGMTVFSVLTGREKKISDPSLGGGPGPEARLYRHATEQEAAGRA